MRYDVANDYHSHYYPLIIHFVIIIHLFLITWISRLGLDTLGLRTMGLHSTPWDSRPCDTPNLGTPGPVPGSFALRLLFNYCYCFIIVSLLVLLSVKARGFPKFDTFGDFQFYVRHFWELPQFDQIWD